MGSPPVHPDYRTLREGDYARTTGSNLLVRITKIERAEDADWNDSDNWIQGIAPKVTFRVWNSGERYTWRLSDLKPLTPLEKLGLQADE